MFSIIHNLEQVSPLHVFVTQAIPDASWSKNLINIHKLSWDSHQLQKFSRSIYYLQQSSNRTLDNIVFLSLKKSSQTQSFMGVWITLTMRKKRYRGCFFKFLLKKTTVGKTNMVLFKCNKNQGNKVAKSVHLIMFYHTSYRLKQKTIKNEVKYQKRLQY